MPKETLKDLVDGHELDLSLGDLEEIPVKELIAVPRATHLDLSCNLLRIIEPEFSALVHLVRLDLSKNQIKSLPANFGDLAKLQYLDLFQNELSTLPVSMCRLGKLRWLDVKNNPIHDTLQSVAGDCLNEVQCRACAKNIVAFMKQADAQQEKEKQLRLEKEQAKEKKRKAAEEKAKEKARQLKKREKEREKDRKRQLHDERVQQETDLYEEGDQEFSDGDASTAFKNTSMKKETAGGVSFWGVFFATLCGLLALVAGLYVYCMSNKSEKMCVQSDTYINEYVTQMNSTMHFYLAKAQQLYQSYKK